MAANLQSRGFGSFSKKFINQLLNANSNHPSKFLSSSSSPVSPITIRRSAHYSSVYDKNIDDQVCASVLPDDVIQPSSEKYWGPNPHTGVFGPPSTLINNGKPMAGTSGSGGSNTESVLELKAWFRPLEDVEKPQQN